MMTVLLVFKTLSMLFESIRYHYLRLTGAAEAWSIVYYLFAFLKGITLFVVVLLIGTGWSLIKPFLNDRDKRIIIIVLSLQVAFFYGFFVCLSFFVCFISLFELKDEER